MSESSESNSYLATKVKYLNPKELHVNILLDEIHIKPCVNYKNSKLSGATDEGATATSLHCFMISSLLSSNKDAAALIPAKNLTAENLCNILKSLLKRLVEAQYNVISIISDGNRINRKLFTLFAGCSSMAELPSWVVDPFNDQQCIFLLFDSVCTLKCIRNNWLNLKNCKKTFIFPDIADNNKVLYASFAELESIYLKEAKYTLKKAPSLSWKAPTLTCWKDKTLNWL